jgi:hypothetical protein
VKKALENKDIVTIGKIKPAIGRPKLVFSRVNPSAELLAAAVASGVILVDEKSSVTVTEVKTAKTPATATVAAQTPAVESAVPATKS